MPTGRAPECCRPRRDFTPARVVIFTGTAGAWKGIFSVHSWIVLKRANESRWTRYDVVGWGEPVRRNNWPVDGRWYGNKPVMLADISGPEAETLIPRIEKTVNDYDYAQAGDYRIWPGPNSNSFVAAILRTVPELGVALPPNALGRDFRYGLYVGMTDSGTGLEINLNGYAGIKVGWVEGIEVNFLGLVAGLDLRHPGRSFLAMAASVLNHRLQPRWRADFSQALRAICSAATSVEVTPACASWQITLRGPDARHATAARQDSLSGDPSRASWKRCRSMSAIAATSPASIATSMPAPTGPRR